MTSLDKGADAAAWDLLDLHDALPDLRRPAGGSLQQQRNGMPGEALRRSGDGQKVFLADAVRVQARDFKAALGNGTGLAENHGLHAGQDLKAVVSLAQDAVDKTAQLAAEAGKRNGDGDSAGVGKQQEDHAAADPAMPLARDQRGDQNQQKSKHRKQRTAEAGNANGKTLRRGLVAGSLFHLFQKACSGGIPKASAHQDRDPPAAVDRAGIDLFPGAAASGSVVPGQGKEIQLRHTGDDGPVQGDRLMMLHHDGLPRIHILRRKLHAALSDQDAGLFRQIVPQHVKPRISAGQSIALQDLHEPVQDGAHGSGGLFPDAESGQHADQRQQILVRKLMRQHTLQQVEHQGKQCEQGRKTEHGQRGPARQRKQKTGDEQQRRRQGQNHLLRGEDALVFLSANRFILFWKQRGQRFETQLRQDDLLFLARRKMPRHIFHSRNGSRIHLLLKYCTFFSQTGKDKNCIFLLEYLSIKRK